MKQQAVRTTVEIPTSLYRSLKQQAAAQGRLVTTEKIMGKDVKTMSQAWDLLDKIWADDRIAFLPEGLEEEFRKKSKLSTYSPKVWADAYLLAFASISGVKLVTFDRGVRCGARCPQNNRTFFLQPVGPS